MNNISILAEIFISASIIFRKCPKRVVLKITFISVCHQENEVFHKSFASLFQKRVRFGVKLQGFKCAFSHSLFLKKLDKINNRCMIKIRI